MCGRFTRSSNITEHANQATFLGQLGLWKPISAPPSYNIAPTQQIAAVRSNDKGYSELAMLRWGLVPGWAPDLFELLSHDSPHWAGNLNVFVAAKPVERHLARALRIYPGRPNMAMFVVGSAPDAYCFALRGGGAQWQCGLYNASSIRTAATILSAVSDAALVEEDRWIEIERQTFMMLAIRPPAKCDRGSLEVHVTQRSCGRTAIVEFDLDPRAAGPGCFVV